MLIWFADIDVFARGAHLDFTSDHGDYLQKMLILNAGDLVLKPSTVIGAAIENWYIC